MACFACDISEFYSSFVVLQKNVNLVGLIDDAGEWRCKEAALENSFLEKVSRKNMGFPPVASKGVAKSVEHPTPTRMSEVRIPAQLTDKYI